MMRACLIAIGAWVILGFSAGDATAGSCNLPPDAVDDNAGHLGAPLTIDVLANDQEPDGEPLSLEILTVSAPCQPDQVLVDHGHIRLTPNPPGTPKSCTITYRALDERGLADTAVLTLTAEGIIFIDGFESGTTSAWSIEP